ncbi:rRNA maturation RNase YbeY [Candidatus Pantoea edessiphila]|uniref:Endoribonuclease YbeY n=1 Tax=Candidatus Pantoea edessiphila TaxID=2044610 RepID=A0A2P5SX35_9GAMM|nr:rRNA maturation RNase YbeY [Candidatus Pantoea edessiphila]PPI86896.1 rRNA maturation RNase YbeY [Candidatus Pantoea edessiphila]
MKWNNFDLQIACKNTINIPNIMKFQCWIKNIFIYLQIKNNITIRLVDKEESCKLNLMYRKKNNSTNILSFPFEQFPFIKLPLLGDLVICFPLIEEESIQQGKTIEFHLLHIIVHGILHLLGYTHNKRYEAKKMEFIEIKIMSILGYPNPYYICEK